MGSNAHYSPRHATVWTIIREDEADRSHPGHRPAHVRTDLMSGYKSIGSNR